MAIHPVSIKRHAIRRWRQHADYTFCARDHLAPLVAMELPRAAMVMPVAFVELAGVMMPVAVLGIEAGKNLFVSPKGRWLGHYVPATWRTQPFRLGELGDQLVLCVDEDNPLVGDDPQGQPFFGPDQAPTDTLNQVLALLTQIHHSHAATRRIGEALKAHGLLKPWDVRIQRPKAEQKIEGLWCIDEAALNRLNDAAFCELRGLGALPVAWCQLMSMQHLPKLGTLAGAQAEGQRLGEAQRAAAAGLGALPERDGELDLDFLLNNDTITFGNV